MVRDKSFVFSAIFPDSKKGLEGLTRAMERLSPWPYSTVEYYCRDVQADKIAALLGEKKSVFLAGALQKELRLNPCSLEKEVRKKAVGALAECFRFARQAGAGGVLVSSGQRPENEKDDPESLKYLADSLEQLHGVEPELPIGINIHFMNIYTVLCAKRNKLLGGKAFLAPQSPLFRGHGLFYREIIVIFKVAVPKSDILELPHLSSNILYLSLDQDYLILNQDHLSLDQDYLSLKKVFRLIYKADLSGEKGFRLSEKH
ncbi:MAG: sugar phosphate isomerase/epimerase [Treponema sp.]|nr:sugar phosphate isomerase/epimerase [Treponema sp.]